MKTKEDFPRVHFDGSPYVEYVPSPNERRALECDRLKVMALEAVLFWMKAERALLAELSMDIGQGRTSHEARKQHMAAMARKFPDLLESMGATLEEIAEWASFSQ